MELTQAQHDIINSSGDIKINAVAGSGKTTTVIEYARSRPQTCRILYLAFNRSVKLEAERKFGGADTHNVFVETAHSLAYRQIVMGSRYRVRAQSFKTQEIVQILGLRGMGEKHAEYVIANHINKFISFFCNSDKHRVQELDYRSIVTDADAKEFVAEHYATIEMQTRLLLSKMDKAEIDITHDFYLKKFQLSQPELRYDYILFDEGQDASASMLDIFLRQKATKVIVGDTNQQIYAWRFAVNSLEKTAFRAHHLSVSFRFGQEIANLAMAVLKWKAYIDREQYLVISGKGTAKEAKATAIIARTNLGLLLKAIDFVTQKKKLGNLYFEGNINSYTYADDGASLYDVLNLYNGTRLKVKDLLIRQMKSIAELEEYIKKTADVQLGMMVEIVKKYGNKIPAIIKSIKDKHIDNDDKSKADMIFSTVHRCKGMEYDTVHIADDFITEKKLDSIVNDNPAETIDYAKLNEEINLLYVAVTRARVCVHIPEMLVPKGILASPHVRIVLPPKTDKLEKKPSANGPRSETGEKAYTVEEKRALNKSAYQPWTPELDDELTRMYCEGIKLKELAEHFGRKQSAISSRVRKLELDDLY